jgi:hypothetical protein
MLSIFKRFNRLFLALSLLIFSQSVIAQQLVPPQEILYAGQIYKLAFKQASPNGRAIYEYTTNGEPVEQWTSLVTLNFAKGINAPPVKWTAAMKASLEANNPDPHFKLYTIGDHGYARFVFEPDQRNPFYESNAHKSFHLNECGGLLVFQYAVKYPQLSEQVGEDKLAALTLITKENERMAAEIEQSEWRPECY